MRYNSAMSVSTTTSESYRLLGRRVGAAPRGFVYQDTRFDQDCFHVFAGLCAVDTPEHVATTMKALQAAGVTTARMGAYKPRTSPYDFQGLGQECLPYVFELAGKHGIRVIAMEVLHERHIVEIRAALAAAGRPCGVMLQIGTRNAQNFELLKHVGQQTEFPVLYKRGMGVTIDESLSACEYIASSGQPNIVFCLRGVKTHLADPHRNLVDFAQVPVIKRLTTLPVCIDPSHSIGERQRGSDGLTDIFHATAQGLIAGANMVLVDVHPAPERALCDGPQALTLEELGPFLEDVRIVRDAYDRRRRAAQARTAKSA
jgi:3-deoxy-7-phosphoheptulonate synthase